MHSRNASTSSKRLGKSCAIPEKSLLENIGPATRTSTSTVRVYQLTCNFFHEKTSEIPWPATILWGKG